MKIVFINPSLRPESKRRQLPVGLGYILTSVKKAGFDFELIDMDINKMSMSDLENKISTMEYDVIAFGCIVTGFKYAKLIAEVCKRYNPNCKIIVGNSVADSIPGILLKETDSDIAVIGEGDITIVELLEKLFNRESIGDIRGIVYKNDGKIIFNEKRTVIDNLDILGFPDWKMFDLEVYNLYSTININVFGNEKVMAFPLNSARGCPYKCTFCYHVFRGSKYRKYSENAILDEINRLHYDYGCNYICFWDELSFPSLKSIENMLRVFEKLPFNIGWDTVIRGNLIKKNNLSLVKEMKDSGCDNVSFSLENASPEILAAMHKKLKVEEFIEQCNTLWEGGLVPLTSVIFGYPQETPDSIRETLKVCEESRVFPSVGFLLPLPGTEIYEWAKNSGFIENEVEYLERIGDRQDFHINLTRIPDDEFISIVETGLKELALKQGLQLESVFKTTTYQKPKNIAK